MADQADRDPPRDVLGSLPRSRPARRSTKRAPAQDAAAKASPAAEPKPKPAAKAKAKATAKPKPKPAAKPTAARKPPPPRPAPPPSGYAVPEPDPQPASGDLLLTAAQAAIKGSELAVAVAMRGVHTFLERLAGQGRD